jgi:hypothetical protein
MRALRHNVDARAKHILRHAPCGLSPQTPFQWGTLKVLLELFMKGFYLMTNETQKPVAPGTTKVDPAVTPAPQQNQGDAKPSADKPANQQQK